MIDKRKTTRKLLWLWGSSVREIERLERDRAAFRTWADDARCTLRAQQLTGMPRGGKISDLSDVIDVIEDRAAMYDEECRRIDAEIQRIIYLRKSVDRVLRMLSPMQEKVCVSRYAEGHNWVYIGMKINRSEDYAKQIDAEIVDIFSRHLEPFGRKL